MPRAVLRLLQFCLPRCRCWYTFKTPLFFHYLPVCAFLLFAWLFAYRLTGGSFTSCRAKHGITLFVARLAFLLPPRPALPRLVPRFAYSYRFVYAGWTHYPSANWHSPTYHYFLPDVCISSNMTFLSEKEGIGLALFCLNNHCNNAFISLPLCGLYFLTCPFRVFRAFLLTLGGFCCTGI